MRRFRALLLLTILIWIGTTGFVSAAQETGSIGLQGRISAPAPTVAATVNVPRAGQTFTTVPVTVSGSCGNDLLVKIFKNNVFAGAVQCSNGSYTILIDLFSGRNDLIARVYDSLDQSGPDSAVVTVNYQDAQFGTFGTAVSLTSTFAKKGANPGDTLTWPLILSGGTGPYALSIDWGDQSEVQLKSQESPGNLDIDHVYKTSGIYRILIKVTDKNGSTAFLQLVGVANGALGKSEAANTGSANGATGNVTTKVIVLWWPVLVSLPLLIITFWLGRRHELFVLRKQFENREQQ